jgi:hypothetical protein
VEVQAMTNSARQMAISIRDKSECRLSKPGVSSGEKQAEVGDVIVLEEKIRCIDSIVIILANTLSRSQLQDPVGVVHQFGSSINSLRIPYLCERRWVQ